MSDHALDIFLDKADRAAIDDGVEEKRVRCGWCRSYVLASQMVSEFSFECKACQAEFEADNAEVAQMFVEFGGEL